MKKIFPVIFLLILLSALGLAGCHLTEAPSAIGQKTLNLYGIDPITLDPAVSGEATSHEYIVQIYSGLMCLDDNLQPVPDIAQRWEINNDGQIYTFYLRPEAKFSNGRKVTAADFKYSWERACNPATESGVAATYLGDIVGALDMLAGNSKEMSGVKVIADDILQVTIDAPKTYFLAKLTYPTAFVVDRANVEKGEEWWRQPNGTGPFRLIQWQQGNLLVLGKNELYYGDISRVDQVNFQLWSGIPMRLYETGDIDAAEVTADYIYRVTDEAGPFYTQLQVTPELSFSYIGFNTNMPPFDDVNIRRAFSQAIDKDKLVSLVFRNMLRRADGILPPGIPGFNNNLIGLGFDVNRAKELIASSKYGSVSELSLITITTTGWGGAIAPELEAIIQEWRENLGVEVEVRQLEPDRFLYHLKEEKDEMYYMGWVADYPHPQDFLDILFHTGAENNFSEYSNADIDSILERAAIEPDNTKSLELYQQAEQELVDDAACLPLFFGQRYTLVKPYIQSYRLNPMGLAELNRVSILPH